MRKTHPAFFRALWWVLAAVLVCLPVLGRSQEVRAGDTGSVFEIPLEDLVNVQVVSPSRVEQQMFDSPNSIWVISREDIRRSGVRSIPEALRMAPGVYVAQISGNRWTVTIGGFARGEFSNTLLVLVDGVSVYSNLYGYVEWDLLPVTLEEIERIEVIRGPGGVLYGANAVNGVINIITARAGAGGPAHSRAEVGTQGVISTRTGGSTTSDNGKFQASWTAGYNEDNGLGIHRGQEIHDYQRLYNLSIRTQTVISDQTGIGIDARYLGGEYGNPGQLYAAISETTRKPEWGIARIRLDHYFEQGGQLYLQAYYSRQHIMDRVGDEYTTRQDGRTQDLEFQHLVPFELLGPHQFIYGGGYRWGEMSHEILADEAYYYTVANLFVHDEWRFLPAWRLNLGAKYEQVSTITPTWQWRAALLYYVAPQHVLRLSAANAYRSPTALENNQEIIVGLPPGMAFLLPLWPAGERQEIVRLVGNEHLKPEQSWSYEAEYRGLWFDHVYFDLSYSFRQYDNLIVQYEADHGFMINLPPEMGPFGVVYDFKNFTRANSHTVEAGLDARITRGLSARVNYGYVEILLEDDRYEDLQDTVGSQSRQFGHLGLFYAGEGGFAADASAYYLGAIDPLTTQDGRDEYWRLDLRVAKKIQSRNGELEIGAVGQNLGQEWHVESGRASASPVRRGYYGYLEYRMK